MWNRLTRQVMSAPSTQTISIGQIALPHWMVSVATASGASNSIAQMAKFDGFHRWRPLQRITYFDVIEIALASANGQNAGERSRMPMLIPEMYELARFGYFP